MVTRELEKAFARAQFERLGPTCYWGSIPGYPAVFTWAITEQECSARLERALCHWLEYQLERTNGTT